MNPLASLRGLAALAKAGNVMFERPDRLPRAALALAKWGPTFVGLAAAAAARYPERLAIVDEDSSWTYGDLWRRTNALADGLAKAGVRPGSTVAILCANSAGFIEATLAAAKSGANVVFLNTGFAGATLAGVVTSEGVDVIIHDDDLSGAAVASGAAALLDESAVARLVREGSTSDRPRVAPARFVILTSGTTGRPKGAARLGGAQSGGLDAATALLDRIPLRTGDRTVIAAPLFHAWGLANLGFAMSLSSTVFLSRRFDPEATMATIRRERVTVLVVVPIMVRRLIGVEGSTPSLRVIASSGSAIDATLVTEVLARFGDVLCNVYGSTEVSIATIATPADLRAAPTTAGMATLATIVRTYALETSLDHASPSLVPTGATGRIFVGNRAGFDGYTDGSTKATLDGLVATGDLGHFDALGRLYIDGREDDMIVSGGENVYPREVEDLLGGHRDIVEAAVVGVPDEEFGQRLVAYVVKRAGSRLSEVAVKAFVSDQLARHKVPRDVLFLSELPRNATGKVLRRALRPQ